MVSDREDETFWMSKVVETENEETLTLRLDEMGGAMLQRVEIVWMDKYVSAYVVEAKHSQSGVWEEVHKEKEGDGGIDQVTMSYPMLVHELRIRMQVPSNAGVGVREVRVFGCDGASRQAPAVEKDAGIFVVDEAGVPVVHSVTPSLGTTAGGSDVTIRGTNFGINVAAISVRFGSFACKISFVGTDPATKEDMIKCVTSASGVQNGGVKYTLVELAGVGASVPNQTVGATFWYVDAWSSRTTWGGNAPPTGCGSWKDDKLCTETIVIPEGQVVLLDVSPPRFYLILVMGTLIFERKDLHLQAVYIFVRGGYLQIGTEADPFTHEALITLYGMHARMLGVHL